MSSCKYSINIVNMSATLEKLGFCQAGMPGWRDGYCAADLLLIYNERDHRG
jgi:hypothetical protein